MNGLKSIKIALPHATSHSCLYKWKLITHAGEHCRWSAFTAVKAAGTTLLDELSDKLSVPLEQKIHAGEKPVLSPLSSSQFMEESVKGLIRNCRWLGMVWLWWMGKILNRLLSWELEEETGSESAGQTDGGYPDGLLLFWSTGGDGK